MPKHWRFRRNWRGQFILQRGRTVTVWDHNCMYPDSWQAYRWHDATLDDIIEFNNLKEPQP